MKSWVVIFVALFMLVSPVAQAAGYVLRAGDALDINVMGFDELNQKPAGGTVIRPDGTISFPFVGELMAQGLTAGELGEYLATELKRYYNDPMVTVNVLKFNTTRVYVLGEVNRPGLYELDRHRNLTEALGLAGGWTKDAAKTKILIIHIDKKGTPDKINLMELLKKGDLSQNPTLSEGDIIYLSDNGRVNIAQDILPYVTTAYLTRYYWNGRP
ncbi:MAG: polysaccharide export protein [Negativicutes bacterium]|nr:polysaccharide export protein [Negativicutes bacterium]